MRSAAAIPKTCRHPAVGEPFTRDEAWLELVPSLQRAKANGHILLLHEYGFDFVTLKTSMPYLAMRYRHAYRLLAQYNADPPLVISEASAGVGYAGIAPKAWIDDAAWYDSEIDQRSRGDRLLPVSIGRSGEFCDAAADNWPNTSRRRPRRRPRREMRRLSPAPI